MPAAAIYTRVSSKDQASKGFSLDAQEKIGRDICARNGWQYTVYEERGRSADKETLDNRPALEQILDLAEDGKIQFLFVTELDRLSRNPVTLAYIKKILLEADVKVVTPGQTFDFRDDEDDFLSDLLGILAKRENRLRVKRSRRAKTEAVKLGRWVGSTLPYGFTKSPCEGDRIKHNQIVPDAEEGKVYLRMVDWSMRGLGTNAIALKLNDLKVTTRFTLSSKQGKSFIWKAGTVHRILTNPIYKGDYTYGDGSAKIGGLISPDNWADLQSHLKRNYNNARRNTKRFYLLRGLLVCKRCGQRLYGLIKPSRGMRCYCCLSKRPDPAPRFCGLKNVPLDVINGKVWDKIRDIVSNGKEVRRLIREQQGKIGDGEGDTKAEMARIDQQIAAANKQADKLLELYSRNEVPMTDLERKVGEIKKRRDGLKSERDALAGQIASEEQQKTNLTYIESYLKNIRKQIDSFSDQEKYDLLHMMVTRIMVDYDPKKKVHVFDIHGVLSSENDRPPITTTPYATQWHNQRYQFTVSGLIQS